MPHDLLFSRFSTRPTRAHPLFWDADRLWVELYFYLENVEQAQARISSFCAFANLELLAIETLDRVDTRLPQSGLEVKALVDEAMECGFAVRMFGVTTGADPSCLPEGI